MSWREKVRPERAVTGCNKELDVATLTACVPVGASPLLHYNSLNSKQGVSVPPNRVFLCRFSTAMVSKSLGFGKKNVFKFATENPVRLIGSNQAARLVPLLYLKRSQNQSEGRLG